MTNQPLRRIAPAALILPLLAALPASGQTLNEDDKLTASDAAVGDSFGTSVAISGTTAIVGAHRHNGSSGAAYLFNTSSGLQTAKLTASDASATDFFGFSVAMSGTTAIVGAYRAGDDIRGGAYLFDISNPNFPVQTAKLTPSVTRTDFGRSVAISGTTAIVGANRDNSSTGLAYLFNTRTGTQIAALTASDGAAGDEFGTSVAISGTTAIVGAWGNDDAGADSGSAYLFDFSDRNNIIETKLNASDGAAGDNFGWSVAISGNTASVGARWDDDSGSVYVFDTTTGQQMAKLTASDAAADDRFGGSTAISGTTAIVGANGNDDAGTDSNSGSAYLFKGGVEIVQQPEGDFVRVGDSVSFEVVLSNPSDGTYQWRRNGTDLTDGGNISGATTSTLSIVAAEQDVAYYDCVVDGISGLPLVTNRAVLAILPDPNACYPDANGDGVLDFFDISQFIIEFGRGCP
jgi:hypothetical protein